VYTINAIDLAIQLGMGKRTNTILQAAFFALAKVLPPEDAIRYMKDAATHSYLKKGQDVVDRNHKAIDAGASALVKIDIPASWATAVDDKQSRPLAGDPKLVKMVEELTLPMGRMDGDCLPVSAFAEHVDGTFEQGASAYEKRGVAVSVPTWNQDTCIQCNQCSYVCPHATIRPYALTKEELSAAPEGTKSAPFKAGKGKGVYDFALAISPLDCMGCAVCAGVCPTKSLTMVAPGAGGFPAGRVRLHGKKRRPQGRLEDTVSVKGSQFKKAAAGVLGLLRRLRRDRLRAAHHRSLARGCTSPTPPAAPPSGADRPPPRPIP
jgi:pyruvate-ferredoxin/flavodoxin oxidoreductase